MANLKAMASGVFRKGHEANLGIEKPTVDPNAAP
jgi:hypothetical protein